MSVAASTSRSDFSIRVSGLYLFQRYRSIKTNTVLILVLYGPVLLFFYQLSKSRLQVAPKYYFDILLKVSWLWISETYYYFKKVASV